MRKPTGIIVNNTHLLRAAMLLMVLGVIGPGLFQLKPPRWFSESDGTAHLETAADDDVALVRSPVAAPLAIAPVAQPAIEPSMQSETQPRTQPGSQPGTQSGTGPGTEIAAPRVSGAADADINAPDSRSFDAAAPITETEARRLMPPDQTEQPAVAARKTVLASQADGPAKVRTSRNAPSAPLEVMRKFTKSIPQSHTALPVKRQKENFISITLPLILAANEEIAQRRNAIKRAIARGERPTIERWARLYRIDIENESISEVERQLLLRADFVPVSLALAQAAIESGWGTSRFALQGNALFGQWAWQKDAGLKPARASNSEAVVRSFPNLFGSVRAYMHNLNTHPRYAAFRARRYLLRGRTQAEIGYQLSNFLDGYAEIGEAYVAKIKTLIRSNNFGHYETARLH